MHTFDRQTDRQTDGQTDRIPIAIPRLHSMQRGKKHANMRDFFSSFPYNYKTKLLVSHVGLWLFGFQNQTVKLYKMGLNDE